MTTTPAATTPEYAIDQNALDVLFLEARSANSFSDEPVDADTLAAIYDLAKMGPTMMNTSPMRVVFVTSDEGKARLLPNLLEGNRAKTAAAPAVAILAVDTDFHEQIPTLFPHAPERKAMFDDEGFRAPVGEFSAALQMGYFIMAIRALGLAAGPMTGADFAGIDAEFFADSSWKAKMVVNIGKPGPDAWFDRLPRLDADVATITI